jgi:hypothetical protein
MAKVYPGSATTALQLKELALHYADAACVFEKLPHTPKGLALVPFRLLAIHAIELTFNAVLVHNSVKAEEIRAMHHDLRAHMVMAETFGLKLRPKTVKHICDLTANREYLVHRYDPAESLRAGHLNRLIATLREVSKKTNQLLAAEKTPTNAVKQLA